MTHCLWHASSWRDEVTPTSLRDQEPLSNPTSGVSPVDRMQDLADAAAKRSADFALKTMWWWRCQKCYTTLSDTFYENPCCLEVIEEKDGCPYIIGGRPEMVVDLQSERLTQGSGGVRHWTRVGTYVFRPDPTEPSEAVCPGVLLCHDFECPHLTSRQDLESGRKVNAARN